MNLVEAIKASTKDREHCKRFRRKGWTHAASLIVRGSDRSYMHGQIEWENLPGERAFIFYYDDIASDDWEVLP